MYTCRYLGKIYEHPELSIFMAIMIAMFKQIVQCQFLIDLIRENFQCVDTNKCPHLAVPSVVVMVSQSVYCPKMLSRQFT